MGNSHPNWGLASTASEIVAGVDLAVRSEHAYDLELAEMLVARAARLIA